MTLEQPRRLSVWGQLGDPARIMGLGVSWWATPSVPVDLAASAGMVGTVTLGVGWHGPLASTGPRRHALALGARAGYIKGGPLVLMTEPSGVAGLEAGYALRGPRLDLRVMLGYEVHLARERGWVGLIGIPTVTFRAGTFI